MSNKMDRIAICQPNIMMGGRLRVILGIVDALNRMGIIPDILTYNLAFTPDQIQKNYGQDLKMNFRFVFPGLDRHLPYDLRLIAFNYSLRFYEKDYDLIIDNGNSQLFLPRKTKVITYVHFPRKARIDLPGLGYSENSIQRKILEKIYKNVRVQPQHTVVCNSRFTWDKLSQVYPDMRQEINVIYPPVDVSKYECEKKIKDRSLSVVTIGRFASDKGQLDQIKIAEKTPEINFHLIGFTNFSSYFQKCKKYIEENGVKNAQLHPNLSFSEMINLLQDSRYFLHTLKNEPFGLTAVQALAAGCIPVVHNSGGQKESVFIPELRYESYDEVPNILRSLTEMDLEILDKFQTQLRENARLNYNAETFSKKMDALLNKVIGLSEN